MWGNRNTILANRYQVRGPRYQWPLDTLAVDLETGSLVEVGVVSADELASLEPAILIGDLDHPVLRGVFVAGEISNPVKNAGNGTPNMVLVRPFEHDVPLQLSAASTQDIVRVATPVLQALVLLHSQGIVHGGLERSLIRMPAEGLWLGEEPGGSSERPLESPTLNTPWNAAYISDVVQPADDLRAFATTLYGWLTQTEPTTDTLHVRTRFPSCPVFLDACIARALSPNPDVMFHDASEMLKVLLTRESSVTTNVVAG